MPQVNLINVDKVVRIGTKAMTFDTLAKHNSDEVVVKYEGKHYLAQRRVIGDQICLTAEEYKPKVPFLFTQGIYELYSIYKILKDKKEQ